MTDTEAVKQGLTLANAFELMLAQQTGVVVQLAVKATNDKMDNPEMARLLEDTINALTYGRASGMLFIALAKNFIGELEFTPEVEQEMEDLEEQREVLIKHLTREKE
jgi:hypothetical protein